MCPRPFGRGRLRPAGLFDAARGTLLMCPRPFRPAGLFDAAPTTLRARATPDHGAVHGAQRPRQTCAMRRSSSRARIPTTECESTRGTAGAMGGGAADEPLPGAIQDAVAAAVEDGATLDEIVESVRSRGGDRSPSIPRARRCARARPAEGRWAERMDGLICLQREADRCAEEWVRGREPGAEGRSALIAIETLRTLVLSTMAGLSQRAEPVATEDLARLALALHRIESADKLRIEREQTMADAAAHAGPAARAATMTHAERVETVRRALEGHVFPARTEPPPPESGWAAASPADSHVTPPDPTPERPAADGGAGCVGREHGAGCVGREHGAGCVGRALGAGCRAETAGGGEAALADRPSLLPLGVEADRGEAWGSASAAAEHALPAPQSRHMEREKRHPHLTPALSATHSFPSSAGRSLRELGFRALRRSGAERENGRRRLRTLSALQGGEGQGEVGLLLAQFASRRHGSRMLPDSLGRSGRWITSGFGTGFRMWTI